MIRQSISSNFGVAADGAAMETQVRFVDAKTRLVLVRVPREFCNMIRCSLTMLTHNVTNNTTSSSSRRPTLVASVLSVNGSARTAKLATIARIQKEFQIPIQKELPNPTTESLLLQELQSLIVTIQNID
eukprot:scaffold1934_cov79-Cylindrotheca_fusiformis.AAC.4